MACIRVFFYIYVGFYQTELLDNHIYYIHKELLHVLRLCVVWGHLRLSEWYQITLMTGISNSFMCWCFVSSRLICHSEWYRITLITQISNSFMCWCFMMPEGTSVSILLNAHITTSNLSMIFQILFLNSLIITFVTFLKNSFMYIGDVLSEDTWD